MKTGYVCNDAGAPILEHARRTTNPWERGRGLIGRPPLASGEGLWIDRCGSVHTVGMGFTLDVVFLAASGVILKVVTLLRPFRFAGAWGARVALEMRAGEATRLGLKKGMCLLWQDQS